ncbi:PepSY domain-containing protein [Salmonella enterica]|nr:PepSY domain-containing protein [Salmonella enterica]
MPNCKKLPIVVLSLGTLCTSVFAATSPLDTGSNDAIAINNAKISLKHSIDIAENHVKGIASKAELEQSKQGPVYEVEVVQGNHVTDVKIDADKGTVISSKADMKDN